MQWRKARPSRLFRVQNHRKMTGPELEVREYPARRMGGLWGQSPVRSGTRDNLLTVLSGLGAWRAGRLCVHLRMTNSCRRLVTAVVPTPIRAFSKVNPTPSRSLGA